jgi:hypothetical protein
MPHSGISSAPYHHLMPVDVNEQRLRCSRSNCAGPPITPPSRASSSNPLVRCYQRYRRRRYGTSKGCGLPLALVRVLTLLATGTIAHTLVTSVRRGRRELAILKAVGFVPRQVRAAAWLGFLPIRPPSNRCWSFSPLEPPCTPSLPSCREPSNRTVPNDRGLVITCGRALPAPAGPRRTVAPARRGDRPRRDGAS